MKYPTDITLVGATGLVGHELLFILSHIKEVSQIKAITRSPLGKVPPRTDNIILNLEQMSSHAMALSSQVFICCLGTTLKKAGSKEAFKQVDLTYVLEFAKIAEACGAKKLLVISAMGANADSAFFYNQVKGEMEQGLRNLAIPQIEVFRPSLILGKRKEARRSEDLAQKLSPWTNKFLIGPLKKYRAIKAQDIARAMGIAVLNFQPGFYVYDSDKIQEIADNK